MVMTPCHPLFLALIAVVICCCNTSCVVAAGSAATEKASAPATSMTRLVEVGTAADTTTSTGIATGTGAGAGDVEPVVDVLRTLAESTPQEEQTTHSVPTTFDGANGSHGTMFDVISRGAATPDDPPTITSVTSLHIHVNLPSSQQPSVHSSPVLVYTRLGTHRGHEAKPSEWTLIFNSTVETAGFAKPTWLPTAMFGNCEGCAPRDSLWSPSTSTSSSPDDASSSSSLSFSLVPGHLEIPPGQVRAFYIHLPGKDLRYSNPDPNVDPNAPDVQKSPEGDAIVAHDDQILIAEGTGMGGYWGIGPTPGKATELYSPRVWNGIVNYVVGPYDEIKATATQSILDQYVDGTGSGASATTASAEAPDLSSDFCPRQVETVLQDNMGSFGNMFDVTIRSPPMTDPGITTIVRITGMEIYVDLEKEVIYELRYRSGTFSKAMEPLAVDTKWTLLAEGTVTGAGRGIATLIPSDSWLNQIMVPVGGADHSDSMVLGFYVTLTTPDIRYSKLGGSNSTNPIAPINGAPLHSPSRTDTEISPAPIVGDIFSTSEDGLVAIGIGVGVAEYPLGTTFYGPRLWNGRLLFDVVSGSVPCPTPSPTTQAPTRPRFAQTEVVYEFIVQRPPEITEWDLYNMLDDSVSQTVEGLLSGDSDNLTPLTTQYNLVLEDVVSVTSFGASTEEDCTLADPTYVCVAVNSYVTLKHVLTLDGDRVRALLLKHTDEVADGVGLYSNYIGEEAADAEVIVTLAGVDREMDDNEVKHFEESTKDFLNSAFGGEGGQYNENGEPVRVLDVKVESQYLIPGTPDEFGGRQLQGSSLGVTTSVTAECRRCRDEFDAGKVDDAFDNNPEEFKEELKKARVIIDDESGEQTTSSPPAYFEKVDDITSIAVASADTAPAGGNKAGKSVGTIIIIASSVLGIIGLIFSLLVVRRRRNSNAGQNDIAANIKYGGDYDLDPYAGGRGSGFTGQGGSNNDRQFLLRSSSQNSITYSTRSGSDRSIRSAKRKQKAMARDEAAARKAKALHAAQMQRTTMSSARTAATEMTESSRSFSSAQWSGGQNGSGRRVHGFSPGYGRQHHQQRGNSPSSGRQSPYSPVVGRVSVIDLEAEALASASAPRSTRSIDRAYMEGEGAAAAEAAPYGRGSRSERQMPVTRGGHDGGARFDGRRSGSERNAGGVMR